MTAKPNNPCRAHIVALLLLLSSASPNNARQEDPPSSQPYAPSLVHRHSCEVCHYMQSGKAYDAVDAIRKNASRRAPLKEDEIPARHNRTAVQPISPARVLATLTRHSDGGSHGSKPLRKTTVLRTTDQFTKCKRDCATVAASCELVLQSDEGVAIWHALSQEIIGSFRRNGLWVACDGSQRLRTQQSPSRVPCDG